jgi:threonine synthase
LSGSLERALPATVAERRFLWDGVGNTIFTQMRNAGRELKVGKLFAKFEGGNPTGTQKDRVAYQQVFDAFQRGFETIAIGTCGNYGTAIANAGFQNGLKSKVYIPKDYHTRRTEELTQHDAEIVWVEGKYEDAVAKASADAKANGWYDANPGEHSAPLGLKAYAEIAREVYRSMRRVPETVSVPVGNGTTLAGVFAGFKELKAQGRTAELPRMIAGSSHRGNPIIASFKAGKDKVEDLKPEELHETAINEPLVNYHSFDGQLALDALRESGGFAEYASDRNMVNYARMVREQEGINVLPASTSALRALVKTVEAHPELAEGDHVVILTGRRC